MLLLYKESPEEYLDKIRKENAQNAKNCYGMPTLCSAIHKFRSAYLVEELLKDGATVNAFTSMTMEGMRLNPITRNRYKQWGEYSAIHLAVSLGQHDIVRLLLTHGADLTTKTTKGISCLDFVLDPSLRCEPNEIKISEKDDLEILKIMKNEELDLTRKDHMAQSTVLHRAVTWRCPEIVRYLTSIGLDVNCTDQTSSTPLFYCSCDDMEISTILFENNADPNARNESGDTLYHRIFSEYKRHKGKKYLLDIVHLLHKFSANPNIQNDNGETALHKCLQNTGDMHDQIKLVDFMLKQGADPNIKDSFERTPIYHLLFLPNSEMLYLIRSLLTLLLQFGARFDHPDITGTPLLHILVYGQLFHSNQFDAQLWIEILHPKHKVNLNVQDYYNRTVLHLVAAEGDWKLGEIFLKNGGNLDVLDCDDNTPLDVAVMCKQWEFAKNVLIWPFLVGQLSYFGGKQASSCTEEAATKNTTSNGDSGCECLPLKGLALANYNDNSSNKNNINSNNSNNNSMFYNNQNIRHFGVLRTLQRSNSLPSFESRKRDGTRVVPLGSSVKWTKAKLDTVAKRIEKEGNGLYFTTKSTDLNYLDIYLSPEPKIAENFSTQINESSLLRLCEENSLEFHVANACGEEHCLLAQQVFSLVNDLLTKCSETDPRMKSKLHWTGSSSEGTKMWLPDEFDFLMELVELQDCCYTKDSLRDLQNLILHPKCVTEWSSFCDNDNVISPRKLRNFLSSLLNKVSLELNKEKYPNIHFNLCQYDRKLNCFLKDTKVGVNLTVCWNGEIYKNLTVSIDLTPAIPVVISEKQVRDVNEHAWKELSDRNFHVVPYLKPGNSKSWRASFTLTEVRIVRNLTKKQITLYKCLKFLRDLHGDVEARIPSYHLKTFLLTTLYQNLDEQSVELIELENVHSSASWVILLLKKIAECSMEERGIKHFFLKSRMSLANYDMRWCGTILEHLK